MKKIMNIIRWFYPFLGGIFIFNILRAVTDFTKKATFWTGEMYLHMIAQFFIILSCYLYDVFWRFYWLNRSAFFLQRKPSVVKEYLVVFLQIFVPMNISIGIGEYIGIFYMGDGIVDYLLANVVIVPLLLLYYTFLRNEVVNKKYQNQALLVEKLKTEKSETELNYLKAQYHPHFLFNALNTIYFQINEDNKSAKETVNLLAELLRYQLYDVSLPVPVSREIDFIRNYIRFQKQRVSESVQISVEIDTQLQNQMVHPLLFQPLLENAFKYVGGDNTIDIKMCYINDCIQFTVENSVFDSAQLTTKKGKGIGIENLRRRLALLYPETHTIVTEQREKEFYAALTIKPNQNGN